MGGAAEGTRGIGFAKPLAVTEPGPIPGLLVVDLPSARGQPGLVQGELAAGEDAGPGAADFGPVQNNVSFNASAGATRGIHAEPWDKFVSVGYGPDLRRVGGPAAGARLRGRFTAELDPRKAVFVPRGVGNAFQTLEDATAYSYLVNDHWSADAQADTPS